MWRPALSMSGPPGLPRYAAAPRAGLLAILLGMLGLAAPACLAAGAADPARAARTYTEITTPDFVLLTPEGESRALALATRLVTFRRALESLLGVPLRSSLPTTIFALDGGTWARYAQPRAEMAGYFATQPFAADLIFDDSMPGRQPLELMLHEYTHHLLRTLGPARLPPFVDEGLAQVFGTAQFAPRGLRFALRPDHVALLRASAWMPFERLVEVRRGDAHYLDYPLARLFYAQAWATMFYVLASDAPQRRRLAAYLETLRAMDAAAPVGAVAPSPARAAAATAIAGADAGATTVPEALAQLLGQPAARVNDAVARRVLARDAPAELLIRLPPPGAPLATSVRRVGADEYEVRLGELLLRLGNRATLARGVFRAVAADSAFAARAHVGAALAVLQSGDLQFAATLLDEPALAHGLDAATAVQLARGLLQLSLSGPGLESMAGAARPQRLARARDLFAAALEAPCCWLEATHGYVLAMLALQRPEPGLLARALRAHATAPSNPELAAAVALVHEAEGHAAQAASYWAAAARSLPEGPARARMLERMRRDAQADAARDAVAPDGR